MIWTKKSSNRSTYPAFDLRVQSMNSEPQMEIVHIFHIFLSDASKTLSDGPKNLRNRFLLPTTTADMLLRSPQLLRSSENGRFLDGENIYLFHISANPGTAKIENHQKSSKIIENLQILFFSKLFSVHSGTV